jgi:hypothetical protein
MIDHSKYYFTSYILPANKIEPQALAHNNSAGGQKGGLLRVLLSKKFPLETGEPGLGIFISFGKKNIVICCAPNF